MLHGEQDLAGLNAASSLGSVRPRPFEVGTCTPQTSIQVQPFFPILSASTPSPWDLAKGPQHPTSARLHSPQVILSHNIFHFQYPTSTGAQEPDIEELYWNCFSPKKLLGTIEDAVRPFAESLKSLRLEGGEYTTPELLALLDCFPNLVRLHVARPRPSMHLTLLAVREEMSASPECTRQGVGQIRSLKKLTLENGFTEDACTETLLVLGRYPVIEHLDLRIVDSSHSIWSESLLDIPFDLLKHLHSMKEQALQYSEQGLERLDFKVGWDKTTGTCCSMQFKDRGPHMVALSATLWGRDADVLLSVLSAHVECLQSLDLECHFMHNARGVLG